VGYVGLFVLLFLENASVPLPAELFLPLAGYYVFVGRMSLVGVLGVSFVASALGSIAIFLIALKLGPSRTYLIASKLGLSQKTLAKSEVRLCGRNGPALVLVSQFIPIFGSLAVVPAGALRMSFSKFTLMSSIGSLGATSAYVLLGYALGPLILPYKEILTSIVIQNILYALVVGLVAYGAYYSLRKFRQKRAKSIFVQKVLKTRATFEEI
ncbi:MAG: DedA family protein, partial [Thaumarchaeota archaeon]|nr:DedA family protein [Nitrososphaerota archaeon]